ncbi:hypothetical protein EC988_006307 [Linderina pennispora]|nr:hypothetical protein EC988_006307 [Linderina pennispora]
MLPVTLFPRGDELADEMAKMDLSKKNGCAQNHESMDPQATGRAFFPPTITNLSAKERDAVFNVLEFVIDHARQRLGRAPPNVAHGLRRDEYGNLQVRVSFYFGQLDQICMLVAKPLKMHGRTYTWTTLTNETLVPLSFQAPSVHINTGHINAGFQEYGLVRNLRPIISKDGCNYNGWRCLLTVRIGANVPEQITIVDRNFPSESAVQLAVADDRTYCDKHYYMLPSFCGCLSSEAKTEAKTEAKAEAKTERGEAKTSE